MQTTPSSDFLTIIFGILGVLFGLAIILMPFFIWDIRNTLLRMEKLHHQIANDILTRLGQPPPRP